MTGFVRLLFASRSPRPGAPDARRSRTARTQPACRRKRGRQTCWMNPLLATLRWAPLSSIPCSMLGPQRAHEPVETRNDQSVSFDEHLHAPARAGCGRRALLPCASPRQQWPMAQPSFSSAAFWIVGVRSSVLTRAAGSGQSWRRRLSKGRMRIKKGGREAALRSSWHHS